MRSRFRAADHGSRFERGLPCSASGMLSRSWARRACPALSASANAPSGIEAQPPGTRRYHTPSHATYSVMFGATGSA